MNNYWSTVADDELKWTDKAIKFLQKEFCPSGADPMWSVDYFQWKLGYSNPAGPGFLSLAEINGRIIGTTTITRKRLLIDGREQIGAEIGDTYTAQDFRRGGRAKVLLGTEKDPSAYLNKSIFGRLVFETVDRARVNNIFLIYGTPNMNSYQGYVKQLSFFDYTGYQNISLSRPTWLLFQRKYPSFNFLSFCLKHIEKTLRVLNIYNSARYKRLTFKNCVPSEDELDDLWIRNKPGKGLSIIRDATYWRYRYIEHPMAKYSFFCIRESGHLVGVIVTRLYSAGVGKRVVSIAEWMNDEHIPFGYMLSMVMNNYRDSGIEMFNLWAGRSTQESKTAARSLFFSRNRVPIIFADTPLARSLQKKAGTIKFYLGSTDNV